MPLAYASSCSSSVRPHDICRWRTREDSAKRQDRIRERGRLPVRVESAIGSEAPGRDSCSRRPAAMLPPSCRRVAEPGSRAPFTKPAGTRSALSGFPSRRARSRVSHTPACGGPARRESGADEARILSFRQMRRLDHHAPAAAPRIASPIGEVAKAPGLLAGATMNALRFLHRCARGPRPGQVAGQSQQEAGPVVLAQFDQGVTAESRITPDIDSRPGSVSANL